MRPARVHVRQRARHLLRRQTPVEQDAMTVSRLSTLKSPTSGALNPGAPARVEFELDAARRQLDVHRAHEAVGAAPRATGGRGS
jgi:hypothetical protein